MSVFSSRGEPPASGRSLQRGVSRDKERKKKKELRKDLKNANPSDWRRGCRSVKGLNSMIPGWIQCYVLWNYLFSLLLSLLYYKLHHYLDQIWSRLELANDISMNLLEKQTNKLCIVTIPEALHHPSLDPVLPSHSKHHPPVLPRLFPTAMGTL